MLPTKALYLIMKEAIPNSIKNYGKDYETRLKTQKFFYLFDQIWGENYYSHSWYLAGPYSSTLTHQIYDSLLGSLEDNQPKWNNCTLSDEAKSVIVRVKTLISNVNEKDPNLSESRAYELVGSIWYLVRKQDTVEEIKEELLLNKPHFKDVINIINIIQLVIDAKSDAE